MRSPLLCPSVVKLQLHHNLCLGKKRSDEVYSPYLNRTTFPTTSNYTKNGLFNLNNNNGDETKQPPNDWSYGLYQIKVDNWSTGDRPEHNFEITF